jgi:hypothetical protein
MNHCVLCNMKHPVILPSLIIVSFVLCSSILLHYLILKAALGIGLGYRLLITALEGTYPTFLTGDDFRMNVDWGFMKMFQRKIFGLKRDEIIKRFKEVAQWKISNLYSSPNTIGMIELGRMNWQVETGDRFVRTEKTYMGNSCGVKNSVHVMDLNMATGHGILFHNLFPHTVIFHTLPVQECSLLGSAFAIGSITCMLSVPSLYFASCVPM